MPQIYECVFFYNKTIFPWFECLQQHCPFIGGGVRHLQYDGSSPGKVHNFLQSSSILQGPLYTHLFAGKLIENSISKYELTFYVAVSALYI